MNLNNSIQTLHELSILNQDGGQQYAPLPKVLTTIVFLIITVSFGRYDWLGTLVFSTIPFAAAVIISVRTIQMFKQTLVALPFVLCTGIANCFFDFTPVIILNQFVAPGGWVSLTVLIFKTLASVGAVLLLAKTTSMTDITAALSSLHVPCILVMQIQLLFRYLILVLEELRISVQAYFMRAGQKRLIPLKDWAKIIGGLLIKSLDRANAVYLAMQCRLFDARNPLPASRKASAEQWLAAVLCMQFFLLIRCIL